jgi:hypothetical protein
MPWIYGQQEHPEGAFQIRIQSNRRSFQKVKMNIFWYATLCGIVGRYRRFVETRCLDLLVIRLA